MLTHAWVEDYRRFNINSIMLMLLFWYSKAPEGRCQKTSKWLSPKGGEHTKNESFWNSPSSSWIFMLKFLQTLLVVQKKNASLPEKINRLNIRHDTFRVCLSRWVYGSMQTTLNYKFASMLVRVINIILLHSNYNVECFPDNNLYDSRVM